MANTNKNKSLFVPSVYIRKDGTFRKRISSICKSLGYDITKGVKKIHKEAIKDLLEVMKLNAPVYTGTLRDSGKIVYGNKYSDDKIIRGTIRFDATQEEQYRRLTWFQRYYIATNFKARNEYHATQKPSKINPNPMAGEEAEDGEIIKDYHWYDKLDKDSGYINLIRNGGGREWLKTSFNAFYTLYSAKNGKLVVLSKAMDSKAIRKEIASAIKETGGTVTYEMLKGVAKNIHAEQKRKNISKKVKDAKKRILELQQKREATSTIFDSADAINKKHFTTSANMAKSIESRGFNVVPRELDGKTVYTYSPRANFALSDEGRELRNLREFVNRHSKRNKKAISKGKKK